MQTLRTSLLTTATSLPSVHPGAPLRATLLAATAILLSACGHESQIHDFGQQLEGATSEMAQTIDGDPSARGVKAAYDNFQPAEKQLHEQWIRLSGTRLTQQDKNALSDVVSTSRQKLTDCFGRHTAEFAKNERFWRAMGAIDKDFESHFNVEELH